MANEIQLLHRRNWRVAPSLIFTIVVGSVGAIGQDNGPLTEETAATEEDLRPRVVQTFPPNWSREVPVSTEKILITFDKALWPGGESLRGRSSILPDFPKPPSLLEERHTLRVPVELKPGKVYVFAINESNEPGVGFQDKEGRSALPYFLVFQTEGEVERNGIPPVVEKLQISVEGEELERRMKIAIAFNQQSDPKSNGLILHGEAGPIAWEQESLNYDNESRTWEIILDHVPEKLTVLINSDSDAGFRNVEMVPTWPSEFTWVTKAGSPAEVEP